MSINLNHWKTFVKSNFQSLLSFLVIRVTFVLNASVHGESSGSGRLCRSTLFQVLLAAAAWASHFTFLFISCRRAETSFTQNSNFLSCINEISFLHLKKSSWHCGFLNPNYETLMTDEEKDIEFGTRFTQDDDTALANTTKILLPASTRLESAGIPESRHKKTFFFLARKQKKLFILFLRLSGFLSTFCCGPLLRLSLIYQYHTSIIQALSKLATMLHGRRISQSSTIILEPLNKKGLELY